MNKSVKQEERTRDDKGRWLPGKTANPAGRPKGIKHKLSASFINDLAAHWQAEGGDILRRVTEEDPAAVLRVIASLVPREMMLKLEGATDGRGIIINLLGVSHPLIGEKDITPALDNKSDE